MKSMDGVEVFNEVRFNICLVLEIDFPMRGYPAGAGQKKGQKIGFVRGRLTVESLVQS